MAAVRDNPATPNSGPIALSPDDKFVWMVSPDDNQVVVVRVDGDANQVVKQIPVGRLGQPADVAHAVLFFASEESGYITGQTLPVTGGWM